MSFSGMFAIGLSGVNAFSTSLEAVSDNIANTNTAGYKRARTDFAALVTSSAPDGGIEGGGVGATNRQMINEQGAITRTNSQTDLAVSGDGLFVVSQTPNGNQANEPFLFTRSGGFSAQADGALVNAAGYYLRGVPVDDNGGASVAGGLNGLETVNINRITSLSAPTSAISFTGNLSAAATPGETLTQSVQVIDDAGAASNLSLTFTNITTNQWSATAAQGDASAQTVATGTLVFGADGLVDQAASTFPTTAPLPAGQTVNFDLAALTQLARPTRITNASADGAPTGALTGVEVSRDGRVTANFSNGLSRDIYQIALATFINMEGLEDGPASTFLSNSDTGALTLNIPGTGRAGAVEGAALEISTVDIGAAFSTLIETQRAYSANTRVITLANEMWQTLTQTAR